MYDIIFHGKLVAQTACAKTAKQLTLTTNCVVIPHASYFNPARLGKRTC